MNATFSSTSPQTAWLRMLGEPARVSRRRLGLGALANMIATWEERKRFRLQLARMIEANPHLIDDVGLTREQAEAEVGKPFWKE